MSIFEIRNRIKYLEEENIKSSNNFRELNLKYLRELLILKNKQIRDHNHIVTNLNDKEIIKNVE